MIRVRVGRAGRVASQSVRWASGSRAAARAGGWAAGDARLLGVPVRRHHRAGDRAMEQRSAGVADRRQLRAAGLLQQLPQRLQPDLDGGQLGRRPVTPVQSHRNPFHLSSGSSRLARVDRHRCPSRIRNSDDARGSRRPTDLQRSEPASSLSMIRKSGFRFSEKDHAQKKRAAPRAARS